MRALQVLKLPVLAFVMVSVELRMNVILRKVAASEGFHKASIALLKEASSTGLRNRSTGIGM